MGWMFWAAGRRLARNAARGHDLPPGNYATKARSDGVSWAPPEGGPFFTALTSGVLEALHRHDETKRLAERLGEQWSAYQSSR